MSNTKISGGYSSIGQLMIAITNGFFIVCLALLVFDEPTFDKILFLSSLLVVIILILKNAFDFNDVFIEDEARFLVKNLLRVKHINATQVIRIRDGILPFTYFLQTKEKNYYFFLNVSALVGEITSSESGKALNALNRILTDAKHKASTIDSASSKN